MTESGGRITNVCVSSTRTGLEPDVVGLVRDDGLAGLHPVSQIEIALSSAHDAQGEVVGQALEEAGEVEGDFGFAGPKRVEDDAQARPPTVAIGVGGALGADQP